MKTNRNLQFRKTIKHNGSIEGVGLHSGEVMKLFLHPGEENSGLTFYRKDGNQKTIIPVHLSNVIDTSLAVTLGVDGVHVQTVEHLLFSLTVLGITDLVMEVQGGSEIPILDGSALPFVEIIDSLETHTYSSEVVPVEITKPVMVSDGNRYLIAVPAEEFKISYFIDYPHPLLTNQTVSVDFNESFFRKYIAPARTFGFLRDVEYLKSRGLAQGGSIDNALIYMPDGKTMNEPRFSMESIYHKILDLVGDLALVGRPIKGHVLGSRGGHALDVAFGKKILKTFTNEKNLDYYSAAIA